MYYIFKQFREIGKSMEFETPNLYQLAGVAKTLEECNNLLNSYQECVANKLLIINGEKRFSSLTLVPEPKKKKKGK